MTGRVLSIDDLWVSFAGNPVVKGVSLHVDRGETVALVGESGSGKSVTALSVPQLLPPQASHLRGSVRLGATQMIGAAPADLLAVRGRRVAMVFQEPMTSLNPLHTVDRQVEEPCVFTRACPRPAPPPAGYWNCWSWLACRIP